MLDKLYDALDNTNVKPEQHKSHIARIHKCLWKYMQSNEDIPRKLFDKYNVFCSKYDVVFESTLEQITCRFLELFEPTHNQYAHIHITRQSVRTMIDKKYTMNNKQLIRNLCESHVEPHIYIQYNGFEKSLYSLEQVHKYVCNIDEILKMYKHFDFNDPETYTAIANGLWNRKSSMCSDLLCNALKHIKTKIKESTLSIQTKNKIRLKFCIANNKSIKLHKVINDHFAQLSKIEKFANCYMLYDKWFACVECLWMNKYQFTNSQIEILMKMIYYTDASYYMRNKRTWYNGRFIDEQMVESMHIADIKRFNNMAQLIDSMLNAHNVVFNNVFTDLCQNNKCDFVKYFVSHGYIIQPQHAIDLMKCKKVEEDDIDVIKEYMIDDVIKCI